MPVDIDSGGKNSHRARDRVLQPLPPGIEPGARVLVRGRVWQLVTCEPHDDCHELHLDSLDDDVVVLLWPFDRPVAEHQPTRYEVHEPERWLRLIRDLAARDCDAIHLLTPRRDTSAREIPGRTASANRERAILPYQLAPALAMAAGARRVMLADEVGLGKTAQAGWIIADTVARATEHRVLVAVPAGLRLQWAQELSRLFDIDAYQVDARWLMRTVNDLPVGINVWTPPGVYVVSLDYLKRSDVLASACALTWDLLVVDEAHGAAAPTDRHSAVAAIARRSRAVVLVTATPFSGDDAAYASLMSLGATKTSPPVVVFRRSRNDVGDSRRRRHRFVRVRLTDLEGRLQRMLERYCHEVWARAPSPEGRLAAIVLRKRALSSAAALARSLRRRQRFLTVAAVPAIQLTLFGGDIESEDDEPSGALSAPGMSDQAREMRWLERLVLAADEAAMADSKSRYLRRLLRRIGAESAVVFTEFRDTMSDLAGAFPSALRLHGGMTPAERDNVQSAFNVRGGLLFATDAAAHGLNLHQCCRLVVNFELPWNPARLEQRIGRVDRLGQRRPVHAATLVARDTAEDLVIANITRRLQRVTRTLGPGDPLAALLDEVRIAGVVIGGDGVPDVSPDRGAVATSPIPDTALKEAERLLTLASLGAPDVRSRLSKPASQIVISSLQATTALPCGFFVVAQWTLREPTGRLIACRTGALHADAVPKMPAHASDARELAIAFIDTNRDRIRRCVLADLAQIRETSRSEYFEATTSQIDREIALNATDTPSPQLQRGLFDNRAERDDAVVETERRDRQHEADRRLERLRRACMLEEHVDVKAVLIMWSGMS